MYAGLPEGGSHRVLATLTAGGPAYIVTGLAAGEVVSVQSPTVFGYGLTAPVPNPEPTPTPPPTPTPTPTPTTPACTDPITCSP